MHWEQQDFPGNGQCEIHLHVAVKCIDSALVLYQFSACSMFLFLKLPFCVTVGTFLGVIDDKLPHSYFTCLEECII